MKLIIPILLYFVTINFHGQVPEKAGYLFDENGEIISQKTFEEKSGTGKYAWHISENNDSIVARIILREQYGSITIEERNEIVMALKALTGKSISNDQKIIINYFLKENPPAKQKPCIDHYSSDRVYLKFLKKNKDVFQAFITNKGFSYNKDFVFEDKNETIKKLLFKYAADCGNYIIIQPDGKFYRRIGEYRQDFIPKKLKEDW